MAGLVPAIPIMKMQCSPNRDRRDEPGDDVCERVDLTGTCFNTKGGGKTGMADWRSWPNTQDWRPRLHNRERIRSLARRRKSDNSYGSNRGEPAPGATDAPKPAPRCKERPPRPEQRSGRQPRTSISSCTPWASNKFSQRPGTEPRRGKERLTPCRVS